MAEDCGPRGRGRKSVVLEGGEQVWRLSVFLGGEEECGSRGRGGIWSSGARRSVVLPGEEECGPRGEEECGLE